MVISMATMINCPYCGKLTDPQLETCPHCGAYLHRGAKPGAQPQKTGSRQTCPNCGAPVKEGDIICVACGTNLLTGQKISQERRAAPQRPAYSPVTLGIAAAAAVLVVVLIVAGLVLLARGSAVDRAKRLAAQNRLSEAVDVLQKRVESKPADAPALFELGKLRLGTSQYREAAKAFSEVSKIDPENAEAALLTALALASINDPNTRSEEIAALETVTRQTPGDARGWFMLSLAYGANGEHDKQIEALQKVLSLEPGHAGARAQLGMALALRGDYEEARTELASAQSNQPNNSDLLVALAYAAGKQGDNQAAIDHLVRALQGSPSSRQQVLTQLGCLLIEQGRFADAQAYLEQAITRGESPAARLFLGIALQCQGRNQEALSNFETLSSQPNLSEAAQAAVHEAQVFLAQGDAAAARRAIDRAREAGAGDAVYYTVLGQVHMAENQFNQAQDAFRRAIQQDAQYPRVHLELGLLYLRRQMVTEAVQELQSYLELLGPHVDGTRAIEVRELINQLTASLGETEAKAGPAVVSMLRRTEQ